MFFPIMQLVTCAVLFQKFAVKQSLDEFSCVTFPPSGEGNVHVSPPGQVPFGSVLGGSQPQVDDVVSSSVAKGKAQLLALSMPLE